MNNKNIEEYSITGFSNIISSPIFLAVLALSFILGVSSIFGFFQNPQKLRIIINLISDKVFISDVRSYLQFPHVTNNSKGNNLLLTLHQVNTVYKNNKYVTASSLDYDVSSKNLLADLNAEVNFDREQNIYSNEIKSKLRRVSCM